MATTDSERRAILDEDHLRLLSIFYWISAGCTAFTALIALMYVAIGAVMAVAASASGGDVDAAAIGWVFAAFGGAFFLLLATFGVLKLLTGIWLRRRRNRVPCLIVAGLACIAIPYGTILAVFTFLVLLRPSVADLFRERAKVAPESPGAVS